MTEVLTGSLLEPSTASGSSTRNGWMFFAALLIARVGLLLALGMLTGGREYTSDIGFMLEMAQDPFFILLGTDATYAAYPPLLPLLLAIVGQPLLLVVPAFFAGRLMFLAYELAAWPFLWLLLSRFEPDSRSRRLLAWGYIVLPMGWMTSIVMAQEETISLMFAAAVTWLLLRNRLHAAILTCALAVVAAKIFFLIPLLAMVVAPPLLPARGLICRGLLAALPIVPVYAFSSYFWQRNDLGIPTFYWTPIVQHTQTVWVFIVEWTGMSLPAARSISSKIALAFGVMPLLLYKFKRLPYSPGRTLALSLAMVVWVFTAFYHSMVEYYMMAIPAILLTLHPRVALAVLALFLTLPWGVNFVYGVKNALAVGNAAASSIFVRMYQATIPIQPVIVHSVSLWLFVAASVALAIYATAHALRRDEPLPTTFAQINRGRR